MFYLSKKFTLTKKQIYWIFFGLTILLALIVSFLMQSFKNYSAVKKENQNNFVPVAAEIKDTITLAFVGTTVSEMTAANEGIGYLLISAGSAMQMGLAFAGLVVVGAMAMAMYELFSYIEKHTTAWAHRGSQNS